MDSTYLCRGKRLDNGEWIVGWRVNHDLIRDHKSGSLLRTTNMCTDGRFECDVVRINPATVGRCTGLSAVKSYRGDKPEDKLVFEWDICEDAQGGPFVIKFIDSPQFYGLAMEYLMDGELLHLEGFSSTSDKIIGTIHDKDGVR